jgi:glycosyltransferase involved in cell wall biosynthesis
MNWLARRSNLLRHLRRRTDRSRVDLPAPSSLDPATSPAPRVSVVIPALNEADNLPVVLGSIPADVFEILLVDGASTDGTIEVALGCRSDVRVVEQDAHGKGNALACGFAAATGDIIVMLDADGSANGAEIPRFVKALQDGADFAKGSRFVGGGGSADITPVRKAGNWLLSSLVNLLFRTRYTDLCYGYNAFWRRYLPRLELDCDGFEVETALNIRAARANLVVREVPSFEERRLYGRSHLHVVRDGFRILKLILRERLAGTGSLTQVRRALADRLHGPGDR